MMQVKFQSYRKSIIAASLMSLSLLPGLYGSISEQGEGSPLDWGGDGMVRVLNLAQQKDKNLPVAIYGLTHFERDEGDDYSINSMTTGIGVWAQFDNFRLSGYLGRVFDQEEGTDHYGVGFVDFSYPLAATWVIAGEIDHSAISEDAGDTTTAYQVCLNHVLQNGWGIGLAWNKTATGLDGDDEPDSWEVILGTEVKLSPDSSAVFEMGPIFSKEADDSTDLHLNVQWGWSATKHVGVYSEADMKIRSSERWFVLGVSYTF